MQSGRVRSETDIESRLESRARVGFRSRLGSRRTGQRGGTVLGLPMKWTVLCCINDSQKKKIDGRQHLTVHLAVSEDSIADELELTPI
jgi:hypothetical protein